MFTGDQVKYTILLCSAPWNMSMWLGFSNSCESNVTNDVIIAKSCQTILLFAQLLGTLPCHIAPMGWIICLWLYPKQKSVFNMASKLGGILCHCFGISVCLCVWWWSEKMGYCYVIYSQHWTTPQLMTELSGRLSIIQESCFFCVLSIDVHATNPITTPTIFSKRGVETFHFLYL